MGMKGGAMLARLCWKEFRMFWPLWAFVGLAAVGFQWLLLETVQTQAQTGILIVAALGWTALYAAAVGAAAFAGERENGTLSWLDTLPVSRPTLWTGKVLFGLVSTLVLAILLVVFAALGTERLDAARLSRGVILGSLGVIVLESLAWSLFWSSLLKNVLVTAVLGISSVGMMGVLTTGDVGLVDFQRLSDQVLVRLAGVAIAFAISYVSVVRRPQRRHPQRNSLASAMTGVLEFSPDSRVRARTRRLWELGQTSIGFSERITAPVRAARSLAWMAARESRAAWLVAFVIALVIVPMLGEAGSFVAVIGVLVLLAAGLGVFIHENRQRAFPFYLHHGVRPSFLWIVKEGVAIVGLVALAVLVIVLRVVWIERNGIAGLFWAVSGVFAGSAPLANNAYVNAMMGPVLVGLLDLFAIGQLCGLVIRRGITAGVVALILFLTCLLPQFLLLSANMIPFWSLMLSPLIMFSVSFLWTRDWLLDRSGMRAWLKLAALLLVPPCLLVAAYISYRAWGLPDFPRPFDRQDVRSPSIVANQDAAELYRSAVTSLRVRPETKTHVSTAQSIADLGVKLAQVSSLGWDPAQRDVVGYLKDNQPSLELMRKAVARPYALFHRIENLSQFSETDSHLLGITQLAQLMAVNIREREARGDLKGAWDDIVVIFKMAHHVAAPPAAMMQRWIASSVQETAINQALIWSCDPGQTPAMLRSALADAKPLAVLPVPEEALKAEDLVIENTLRLSASELSAHLHRYTGEFDASRIVADPFVTAPWERKRALRVLKMSTTRALESSRESLRQITTLDEREGWSETPLSKVNDEDLKYGLKTTPLARLLMSAPPALEVFQFELLQAHAFQVVAALRIWVLEHHGEYPENLHQLTPNILERVPFDPYSGQPLLYTRSEGQPVQSLGSMRRGYTPVKLIDATEPGQWLLYSVGFDRRDDHAALDYQASKFGDFIYPLPPMKRSQPDQKEVK